MTVAEFLDWWRSRLGEMVPASLRGSWNDAKTTLVLEIEDNRLALSAPPAQTTARVELTPDVDRLGKPKPVQDFLFGLNGTPRRIRLSLAPSEYLSQQLMLPRAAQAHLAEAVGYQLPQLTPFTSDQLLYACGERPNSSPDGPLSVWLVAVPRQKVTRALAWIDQPPPDNPLPVQTPPDPGEKLVVSWSTRESATSPRRHLRLAWIGLAIAWLAVLGLHSHNRQQEQVQLDTTRAELRARASEVARLRDHLERARLQADWLAQHRAQAISPLVLIDTLTQQLDDQTWLQGLELKGQRLTLRGISASPAALLETLEGSELLQDVRFQSAITRDRREQGDRFNISARLERPAAEDGT